MQTMENYFIIHGTYGNKNENWFGWLEKELKKRGKQVYNFNYPTPNNQNYESWTNVLKKVLNKINIESTFICHSSACIFLIKFCINQKIKIKKAIFVSGFNNYFSGTEIDQLNKDFYIDNIKLFKNYCDNIICFYSQNDPYVQYDYLNNFANLLDAQKNIIKKAGHFNKSAGYINFEEILKFL